jgi:hypothetical protein
MKGRGEVGEGIGIEREEKGKGGYGEEERMGGGRT